MTMSRYSLRSAAGLTRSVQERQNGTRTAPVRCKNGKTENRYRYLLDKRVSGT